MKVVILGLGSVGRGVAEQIAKKDLGITITGIADSKSGCIDNNGIDVTEGSQNKTHDRSLRGQEDLCLGYPKKSDL